ncbi:hypothetical protein J45TS6_41820 [Paenibacillus sp. J45TS6]|uniref:hypothetical protein n=1 Tax=Paenibacillus sp. J45TS6 TaxID=2807196 RepID=UPI001B0A70A1|nr:hypothetical protein [Paenibacillus sp. J45TS6]GIP45723.1 hypothetical protein J45TS6_41820 [Paenibacillus sp. J45TS6]
MGTSSFFLVERDRYSSDNLLSSVMLASFHSNAMLYYRNEKYFTEDNQFKYTTISIMYNPDDDENKFLIYIDGVMNDGLEFYNNGQFLGLDPSLSLYQVGCIEDVYDNEELLFNFVFEYLKLNPNQYYWLGGYNWVYSWEDMQRLKSLPYDPDWCYKNPKN